MSLPCCKLCSWWFLGVLLSPPYPPPRWQAFNIFVTWTAEINLKWLQISPSAWRCLAKYLRISLGFIKKFKSFPKNLPLLWVTYRCVHLWIGNQNILALWFILELGRIQKNVRAHIAVVSSHFEFGLHFFVLFVVLKFPICCSINKRPKNKSLKGQTSGLC